MQDRDTTPPQFAIAKADLPLQVVVSEAIGAQSTPAKDMLRFLAEASSVLASSLDYSTTLASVARLVVPHLADWCALDVVEPDGFCRRVALAHVNPAKVNLAWEVERRYPLNPSAPHGVAQVLRTGKTESYPTISDELLSSIAQDDNHAELLKSFGFTSGMVVPLIVRGRTIGALSVGMDATRRQFGSANRQMVEELAHRAAQAVDNARLYSLAQEEITERKRVENALRASEERFRILFEHSPDAILLFDPHHPAVLWRIVECNAAACRMNGYAREELLDQSVRLISTGQPTREGCSAYLERLRREGTIHSETVHRRKDGTLFNVEFSTSLITLEGHELVLGIDRDVTQKKQAEERTSIRARQQAMVASLGQSALGDADLPKLIDEAVMLVAQTLPADYCGLMELLPDGDVFLLKAGVGWPEGMVGNLLVGADTGSLAGFTLRCNAPVIVDDLRTEQRFNVVSPLRECGATSSISVIIGDRERPFGVLNAFIVDKRTFTDDDIHFLQGIANILAAAVERRRVEEALRQSERRVAGIISSAMDAIISIDAEQRIVLFNTAAERIFRCTAAEVLGKSIDRFVPAHLRVAHARYMRVFGETRTTSRTMQSLQPLTALRADGEEFPIEATISHMETDGQRLYTLIVRDITKRTQAEEELRKSRDQLAIILHGVADGITVQDPTGKLLYANEAAVRVLGFPSVAALLATPPEEVLKKFEIMDERGDLFPPSRLPGRLALQGEQAPEVVLRYRVRGTGDEYWYLVKATPVLDQRGSVQYAISIFSDITGRKRIEEERAQAEALRQMDQLKSQFLASVSHELRTPLHHIMGYASTLRQRGANFDEETTQEYLQVICDESSKLARLIEDLLNTSQIENGTLYLDIDSVLIDELVNTAVQRWRSDESHHFKVVVPREVPPLAADGHRIQQVLDNLLGNAVRHTPKGTLTTVSIRVTREELVVSVSDNGPGISPEHVPHLFDRFYRAGLKTNGRGGSGLGLYICKGIIEQHGGRIWVESTAGCGTTFRFSLPRRRQLVALRTTQRPRRGVSDSHNE